MKITVTIIPTANSLLSSFCPFLQTKKAGFQKVDGLVTVTRNIFVFCLQRVMLYCRAMLNSIDFYKGIFSHVIPVRIITAFVIQRATFQC